MTADKPDGGANCRVCGHYETSLKLATDLYAHCPACGRGAHWMPVDADKLEAGRTCAVWCGTGAGPDFRSWGEETWCTRECAKECNPLNPAPRPVEPPVRFPPVGSTHWSVGIEPKQSRPVERCSCAESVALRKALETIRIRLDAWPVAPAKEIYDIARRALALGEETTK